MCVTSSATSRNCQFDACCKPVPGVLGQHGVCLDHYLDEAFTQTADALRLCQQGEPLESRTIEWLLAQGDFTVHLLAKSSNMQSLQQRSRVLELLLCLTNVHEYLRHHSVSRVF